MKLGGSALAQVLNKLGNEVPTVKDPEYFSDAFNAVQEAIEKGLILAGHDISAGGMITTLLEMCFANVEGGLEVNLDKINESDIVKILFAENPGIIVQVKDKKAFEKLMMDAGVGFAEIAKPTNERHILVSKDGIQYHFGIDYMRDVWYESSYKLDIKQSGNISWISSRAVMYVPAIVSRTIRCSRWNSSSTRTLSVRWLLTVFRLIVANRQVLKLLSCEIREPMVSVKWLTQCIWLASM